MTDDDAWKLYEDVLIRQASGDFYIRSTDPIRCVFNESTWRAAEERLLATGRFRRDEYGLLRPSA